MILTILFSLLALVHSEVPELTDEDFEPKALVEKEPNLFIKFYAPWCSHCKRLDPVWEEAAAIIEAEKGVNIKFASYDVTQDPHNASLELKVAGLPTLYIYHKGLGKKYSGERKTVEDLLTVARNHGKPAAQVLKTQAQIDAVVSDKTQTSVIAFVARDGMSESMVYEHVSSYYRDLIKFYIVKKPKLCYSNWKGADKAAGLTKPPRRNAALAVIRPLSDQVWKWYPEQVMREAEIASWIVETSKSEMNLLNPTTKFRYTDKPMLVAFVADGIEPTSVIDEMKVLASSHEEYYFATAKASDFAVDIHKDFGHALSSTESRVCVWYPFHKEFYASTGAGVTTALVKNLIEDHRAGRNKIIKSEPAPEVATVNGLTTLVGTTFESTLRENEGKHVFLVLHATWCGHCKNLLPIWDEVAKSLESNDKIIVAAMEVTLNTLPYPFTTEGYPTLVMKAPKTEKPVISKAGHSLEAITVYLKDHYPELFDKVEL